MRRMPDLISRKGSVQNVLYLYEQAARQLLRTSHAIIKELAAWLVLVQAVVSMQ